VILLQLSLWHVVNCRRMEVSKKKLWKFICNGNFTFLLLSFSASRTLLSERYFTLKAHEVNAIYRWHNSVALFLYKYVICLKSSP
jgi:hypothetical protein